MRCVQFDKLYHVSNADTKFFVARNLWTGDRKVAYIVELKNLPGDSAWNSGILIGTSKISAQ